VKEGGKIIHEEVVVDQHAAEALRVAPQGVQAHARTPLLVHRAVAAAALEFRCRGYF